MSSDSSSEAPRYLFVSYARQDAKVARLFTAAVQDELRRRSSDILVWTDSDLRPGEAFQVVIRKVLENSVAIMVLVSKASLDSPWVRDEFVLAMSQSLPKRSTDVSVPRLISNCAVLARAPQNWPQRSQRTSGTRRR